MLAFLAIFGLAQSQRLRIKMDYNWSFKLGDFKQAEWHSVASTGYRDDDWQHVNVPHDFVIEGFFEQTNDGSHGYLPGYQSLDTGVGWYRKAFDVPVGSLTRKSAWIEFDGIFRNSTVWLNGHLLGSHPSGYTSHLYHVIDAGSARLNEGANVLVVRADATDKEGWFYEGGGIYRHVWLTIADLRHIVPWGVQVISTVVDNMYANRGRVYVNITTNLRNDDGGVGSNLTVVSRIVDSANHSTVLGESTSTVVIAPFGGQGRVSQGIDIPVMDLWAPENPRLYNVISTVIETERQFAQAPFAGDNVMTRFGARELVFDPDKGLFINGEHVKIKGMANHIDFAGVGSAVPDRLQVFRIQQMLAMGSNAWRCAHNPPSPEFLDMADELGMLVLDENRHFGIQPDATEVPHDKQNGAAWYPDNIQDFRSMLLRDRNHPSIIAWSLCNEPECFLENEEKTIEATAYYRDIVRDLDSSRMLTGGQVTNFNGWTGKRLDIQGINYADGVFDDYHARNPHKPMIGTEDFNGNEDRGEYGGDYASSFDTSHEKWWTDQDSRPFMIGGFAWTGFDYKGESTWPSVNAHFGTLDIAGFPKDRFYWYKAYWGKESVLHLFPPLTPGVQRLMAFTNADRVELFVNGTSIASKRVAGLSHASFDLAAPWSPNIGSVTAHGYRKGQLAPFVTTILQPAGEPVAVQLLVEMSQTSMVADAQDIFLARAAVVDLHGRVVPNASNLINFSVQGPGRVVGVGNGDPHCHAPDKASSRHAFHGLVRVIVQSSDVGATGMVTLQATSDGLKHDILQVSARSVDPGLDEMTGGVWQARQPQQKTANDPNYVWI